MCHISPWVLTNRETHDFIMASLCKAAMCICKETLFGNDIDHRAEYVRGLRVKRSCFREAERRIYA